MAKFTKKNKFLVIIIYLLLLFSINVFATDIKAQKIFEEYLSIIYDCAYGKKKVDKEYHLPITISFIENITQIESKAHAGDFGKFSVYPSDYMAWKKWYEKYKDNLYYDVKADEVKLRNDDESYFNVRGGIVVNQNVAIEIAKSILIPIFGNDETKYKNLTAILNNKNIWIIRNDRKVSNKESVDIINIELRKKDCKVMKIEIKKK